MTLTDPRLQTALDAATDHIRSTVTTVARQVAGRLGTLAQSATRIAERDALSAAGFELRRHAAALDQAFDRTLIERIAEDLAPRAVRQKLSGADWQSLTLVDDFEVEARMAADRLGQQLTATSEEPLRELDAHFGALLGRDAGASDRNPLRGEVLGAALQCGIDAVSREADVRSVLRRELGAALAQALPAAYAAILADLQRRGVQPLDLSIRQFDGPGNQASRPDAVHAAHATRDGARAHPHRAEFGRPGGADDAGPHVPSAHYYAAASGMDRSGMPPLGGAGGRTERRPGGGWRQEPAEAPATGGSGAASLGRDAALADAELMALLRHLNGAASSAAVAGSSRTGSWREAEAWNRSETAASTARLSRFAASSVDPTAPQSGGALSSAMAINLIRAHREELMQAASGRLDHMVIDLVGSLFDQILADSRVPPQMARQIGRLQLPVLRVALSDTRFFSSRRHPVRRFVNRIASLACAFDDFSDGPGRHFLDRVRGLVDEIVDGDFDQIALYAAQLDALERFSAEQAQRDLQPGGTVATLGAKETELRLQQRYALQLGAALQPLPLPAYVRDFLAQVWSQALVVAAQREGVDSDRLKRYRRAGRDLVMSVQPKGLPMLRKRFLMQLPGLMKDLNEGLALIGWPAAAQAELMARLQPAHAESLKAAPLSELDHNLLEKQVEQIFAVALSGQEALTPADPAPADIAPEAIARSFTPEEAQRVGLVTENAVDWSATVDIDLGALAAAGDDPLDTEARGPAMLAVAGIDIDLGAAAPAASAPDGRKALIDHLKLGFAYQMHLRDSWQKVRLAHISAGRSFFVFTSGRRHQETISMTARMLARMCETQRFRAVENRYLVERATRRARQQLAAIGAAATR